MSMSVSVSVCVYMCVCLCEIKSEGQQKTTLRVKPQETHSVTPQHLSARDWWGLGLQPNFKKGALQSLIFKNGVAGKEGVTFFKAGVGAGFTQKN